MSEKIGKGRPQIAGKKTVVTLTDVQRDRIAKVVEGHRMGAFIREAIDHELDRREVPNQAD